MKRRIFALFLTLALLAGLCPLSVLAAEGEGTTGNELELLGGTWIDVDGIEGGQICFDSSTGTITGCKTSVTRADIPQTIDGVSVSSIGRAFSGCTSLTSISIPGSVTSIEYEAFRSCSRLTSISIPSSVTSIGRWAFVSCTSLTSISIPNSVTSIGYEAFSGCTSLTSISIPNSVTSIGTYAFKNCSSLTGISVADGNSEYSSSDGVLFNKNQTTLIAYPVGKSETSYTIPANVTSIGDSAFECCSSLTSITIPNSVTSIGKNAFENCSSLTSISIPSNMTSIGNYAFYGCSSLTSITIPDSITSIGKLAFWGCSSLTSISIPDSVTSIGDSAFWGCNSLMSISIPDSVTSIGNYAFRNCSSLMSIIIPASVTSIESGAFEGCSSLTSISIPGSVTSIGGSAFEGCSSLTSISIPGSVTSIGNYAFSGCSSLTSISIPSSVTSIGNYAFSGCSSLTSISIPSSVTSIGGSAFSGCSSLTSISIPSSVTSIRGSAFSGCSSLTSISIPDSVTSIEDGAFKNCGSLTSISIPDSVTIIGNDVFSGCSSLTNISIPDSVTSIRRAAFYKCTSITSISIPDSVTSIGGCAFSGCSSLTSIGIPSSVTSIGDSAFQWCTSLTSISIPASVTSIGNSAFYRCTSLTDVYYSGSAEQCSKISIGYENGRLTSATIHYNWISGGGDDTESASVPKGKYQIHVVNSQGKPISGASVTYSTQSGKTDANGDVLFSKFTAGNPVIKVEKDDYTTYSNENSNYSKSETSYEVITLLSTAEAIYKLSSALYSNSESMSLSTDLLKKTKTVNLQINTGWNLIGDFDDGKFYLQCASAAPSGVTGYELWQGTKKIADSTDGKFALQNTQFSKGGNCFVNVITKKGSKIPTSLNLTFAQNSKNSAAKIALSKGKASISVPDTIPFLGGSNVSVELPELPLNVYVTTEALHFTFNIKEHTFGKKDNEKDDEKSFAEWWNEQKSIMQRVKNVTNLSPSTLKDVLQNDDSMKLPGGKFKVSVCGCAEAKWGSSTAKGEIYFLIDATSPTFGFNTVVVVVPVTVQIKGNAKLQVGGEVSYNWEDATVLYGGKLNFTIGLEAFGGVGISDLVGVGAYGKASVLTELLGFGTTQGIKLNKIDLTGELGIKAYLACFTYEKPFAYNTWHLYTSNTVSLLAAEDSYGLYNADNYKMEDTSYLNHESAWQSGPMLLLSAAAQTSFSTLLEGTYHNAQPVMVSGENALYAAFVRGDTEGNRFLVTTKYDGTEWAEPVRVDASALCDSDPSLCVAEDGTLWLAYTRTGTGFDKTSLLSFAQNQSIVVGTLDPDTLAFTQRAAFTGSGYLHLPQISVQDETPTLVWLDSVVTDDNSVLSPTSSAICLAEWNGSAWGEKETLTTVSSPVTQLCLGDAVVGYVAKDTLYTVDKTKAVKTVAENVTGKVTFGKLPQTNAETFLWNGAGVLQSADGSVETPGITKEYAVVGDSVYYSAATDGSANLAVTKYYEDGTHSEEMILTGDADRYLENLNVASLDGMDYVLGMHTAAEIDENAVDVSKNLVWSAVQPVSDLRIDGLDYAIADLSDTVPVTVTVTNAGDHAVSGYEVQLDGSKVAEGSTLQPGKSCDITFDVPCPTEQTTYIVSVSQSGEEDYTPENNQAEMTLGYADLSVSLDYENIGTSQTLIATVTNTGIGSTSGELVFCDGEGNPYGETTVGTLEAGDSCIIRYALEDTFSSKTGGEAGVTLTCAKEEINTADNTAWAYIPEQEDSVTVQEYSGEAVTVNVSNTGTIAQIVCALYDENGKLLSVEMEQPEKGTSQCTFAFNEEDAAQVKFFIWDQEQKALFPAQVLMLGE